MTSPKHIATKAALEFYRDHGVDTCVLETANDRTMPPPAVEASVMGLQDATPQVGFEARKAPPPMSQTPPVDMLLGKSDARAESVKLALAAQSLEDLKQAIAGFDGIAVKKTATNLVFSDGNPEAKIMLIGEAPGADEDRQGKPFAGVSGELLDKILGCIDLSRAPNEDQTAVYTSNILNWRPPGNRTPSPAEMEVSLPFIEKHIQLIQPDFLIFCGGISAKSLLGSSDSISRLRKKFHDYLPQTPELREGAKPIPAIATYHPAYLLRTPAQKKAVWQDMLMFQERLQKGA